MPTIYTISRVIATSMLMSTLILFTTLDNLAITCYVTRIAVVAEISCEYSAVCCVVVFVERAMCVASSAEREVWNASSVSGVLVLTASCSMHVTASLKEEKRESEKIEGIHSLRGHPQQ
jgi:hypothetical protein